jgi:hypothetical protein
MASLTKAQPSGYALCSGMLFDIAVDATKLLQMNYENEKNMAQAEGRASQAMATATSDAMNKDADGMTANAYGEITGSAIGLGLSVGSGAYDLVQTVKNPYSAQIKSVDGFEDKINEVESTRPNVAMREMPAEADAANEVRAQLNAVKTTDIKNANPNTPAFREQLESARGQIGDTTYDEFKTRVRKTRDDLRTDNDAYERRTQNRVNMMSGLGQTAGQMAKSIYTMDAANAKRDQATLEAVKISSQLTEQAFKRGFDQAAQNGGTLQSALQLVNQVRSGIADSNKM